MSDKVADRAKQARVALREYDVIYGLVDEIRSRADGGQALRRAGRRFRWARRRARRCSGRQQQGGGLPDAEGSLTVGRQPARRRGAGDVRRQSRLAASREGCRQEGGERFGRGGADPGPAARGSRATRSSASTWSTARDAGVCFRTSSGRRWTRSKPRRSAEEGGGARRRASSAGAPPARGGNAEEEEEEARGPSAGADASSSLAGEAKGGK